MINQIRAELRKIFSLRSTYVIFFLTFAVLCLFAFYVEGFKAIDAPNPDKVMGVMRNIATTTVVFSGLVGILLVTHEYRYNTIMHTLTLSRRRLHVLAAKAIVMSLFSVAFMAVSVAVGIGLMYLGLAAHGADPGPQTVYYADMIWRVLFYSWCFNMFALILAFAIRNQVGSLVAFFFVPGTIESLLGLLLKSKAMYLPFTMLGNLLNNTSQMTFMNGDVYTVNQSQSLALLLLYVAIGWVIVAYLFVRRDAN